LKRCEPENPCLVSGGYEPDKPIAKATHPVENNDGILSHFRKVDWNPIAGKIANVAQDLVTMAAATIVAAAIIPRPGIVNRLRIMNHTTPGAVVTWRIVIGYVAAAIPVIAIAITTVGIAYRHRKA
jgi:hypothetical protein